MIDVVIRNAEIYDGSGGPPRRGDVAVTGDRLASIGLPVAAGIALEEIDATGFAAAPGFIDLHSHSDTSALSDPGCISIIEQGATTIVNGLCGFSAAPIGAADPAQLADEEPIFGYPDVTFDWDSIGAYRAAVARARPAVNMATLIGHNRVRRHVMGGAGRRPTAAELDRMRALIREGIHEGARGFSTGLSYAPGLFAELDELVALARVAADEGVPYHTHMRYGEHGVEASLEEALVTGQRSGAWLNVSHLYPSADEPPAAAERLIELLEASRARGNEVTFDLTVFPRGGGAWVQALPGWARDGGHAATVARIRDPRTRAQLIAFLDGPTVEPWVRDWDDQLIVKVGRPEHARLTGRTIAEIARERGRGSLETALDLVVEDGQFWVAPVIKRQAHLDRLLAHPLCVPIGDGFAAHPVKHRDLGLMPKSFGTFPLVLGSYVRERGVLGLPDAIRKMTALPAGRAGLSDRGRLEAGLAADLVLFDPATVANRATEADPAARPAGIDRVMVNGQWAVIDGRSTGRRAGRSL
jgi:N-acyl-D-amino-acid deacylase